MSRDRTRIDAYLAMCAEAARAERVDASGRVICPDCAGTDPTCFWCDGSGYIDDVGTVDAEDVRP